MNKNSIFKILMIIFSIIVTISFLLPIINVTWMLPGEDDLGNPILIELDNYYSMLTFIFVFSFSDWVIYFPLLYVISALSYGLIFVLKSLNFQISAKVLKALLVYPLLVSLVSLFFFTAIGLVVLISEIICMKFLFMDSSLVFLNLRKTNQEIKQIN